MISRIGVSLKFFSVLVIASSLFIFESASAESEKLVLCQTGKNKGEIVSEKTCELTAKANKGKKWFRGFACNDESKWGWLDDLELDVGIGTGVELGPLSLDFDYTYGVRPTNQNTEFLRLDKWETQLGLSLFKLLGVEGDELFDLGSKINTNADAGFRMRRRFVFGQFFTSASQARCLRNTYLPKDYPDTAAKLQALNIDDYARFDVETVSYLSAGGSGFLDGLSLVEARAQWSRFSLNTVQVHVDKMDSDLVRLRFAVASPIKRTVRFSIGANKRYEIGISSNIDRQLVRLSKLSEYIDLRWNYKEDGETILTDYTIDISDPKMRALYDEVFVNSSTRLKEKLMEVFKSPTKEAKKIAKLFSKEGVQEAHYTNIAALEEEALRQERELPEDQRTLIKNLEAKNTFDGSSASIRAGIVLFNLGFKGRYRLNNITMREIDTTLMPEESKGKVDPEASSTESFAEFVDLVNDQNFIMPVWTKNIDWLWFGGEMGYKKNQRVSVLFRADENFLPTGFESISLFSDTFDVNYKTKEQRRDLARLKAVLPEESYEELLFGLKTNGWDGKSKLKDVRVVLDYSYNNNAYLALAKSGFASQGADVKASEDYIYGLFIAHMEEVVSKERYIIQKFRQNPKSVQTWTKIRVRPKDVERYLGDKIRKVSERVAIAFNPVMNGNERLKQFVKLRKNRMFVRHGVRFMASELKKVVAAKNIAVKDILFFNGSYERRKGSSYYHNFGEPENSALFGAVEFIQQITSNESTEIIEIRDYAKRIKANKALAKVVRGQ